MLKEREVEARYPVEVQAAADVAEAAGIIGTAHKAAVAAVQNELIATGGSIIEPAAKTEKAWA